MSLSTNDVWRILTYQSGAPGFVSEFKPLDRDVAFHIFSTGPDWDTYLTHENGWLEYTSTKPLADVQMANALGVCKKSVCRALQRLEVNQSRPFYIDVVKHSGDGKFYRCFIRPTEIPKFEKLSSDGTFCLETGTNCPDSGQDDSHTNLPISTNPPQSHRGEEGDSSGLRERIKLWTEKMNERWRSNGSSKSLNSARISIRAKHLTPADWMDVQEAFESSYRDGVNNPKNAISNPTAYVLKLINESIGS